MTNQTMSRSKLMNHINHLRLEVKALTDIQNERVRAIASATADKKLDAILVFDTTIIVLKKRIEKYEEELKGAG